jgi:hypothetical protein
VDDEADPPDPAEVPHAPYTPEDGAYAAIVSQYLGLRRHGADALGAALITAANLHLMGMANGAQQPPDGGE